MSGRTLKERLRYDLTLIRRELMTEATRLTREDLGWCPHRGMKTCRELLKEIGTMEAICLSWIAQQIELPWETAVAWSGDDLDSILADLAATRMQTLDYLKTTPEEALLAPAPALWGEFLGMPLVEPAEMLRWIGRHEYYHMGQIVIYRWVLGDNPYHRAQVSLKTG